MNMPKSRDIQAKMPSPKVIYASNESDVYKRQIVSFIRIRLNYNMMSREMLRTYVYAISINSVHRKAYYWERSER